jgi:signal transduction histidine kinase/integral membrane sensor domain MASE1
MASHARGELARMNRLSEALSSDLTSGSQRKALSPVTGGPWARTLAQPSSRTLATAACVAVAYAVTARLGAAMAFPGLPLSALWLPSAILLGALLLAPRRDWWVYLALALPAHLIVQVPLLHMPLTRAVIGYFSNFCNALLAAFVLVTLAPGLQRLDRMRPAAVFMAVAGLVAPVVSSVLAAAALVATHLTSAFWPTAIERSLTNAFACLTVVPLMLHGAAWLRTGNLTLRADRAAEAGALAVALTGFSVAAFVTSGARSNLSPALLYAPYAVLLWGAVRFGVVGACSSALLFGLVASWGALHQTGPFAGLSPSDTAISLQVFLLLICVSLLLLAVALEERKHLERAGAVSESERRQAEMLHLAVLASLHEQIVVLDQAGVIIETNTSWGAFVEPAAGRPLEDVRVGDRYLEACAASAAGGDRIAAELVACIREVLRGLSMQRHLEFSRESPQGLLWYELSVERLRRPEGGAVVTRTDITARKHAFDQLREQRSQLAHLGRAAALGELSGAFAHELVQPLTSILGNAEAALQLLPPATPGCADIRDMLHDIIKDDVRAAEVIKRLRSMLARGEIRSQTVDLNQVVREVLSLARADLLARNVSVDTQLDARLELVLADPVQLQQVLLNLIMNASDAMVGNTPAERRLSIVTRRRGEEGAIECEVADRGPGIPAGDLERIFQPFVTTKKHGLGLGLAICRSIVEAHGGRLWAENSHPGRGAVFRFTAISGS